MKFNLINRLLLEIIQDGFRNFPKTFPIVLVMFPIVLNYDG